MIDGMPMLPVLRHDDLAADQLEVWSQVTGGRRAAAHGGSSGLVTAEGGLIGPFNAWLHGPALGLPAAQLGEAVRFGSSLDRATLELVICVVAAHWRAEFEYVVHRRYAEEAGVAAALLDAVGQGAEVSFAGPAEQLVVAVTRSLLADGRVPAELDDRLLGDLGATGAADLVTTVGYYTMVSFNLNAFGIPRPEGSSVPWATPGA